MKTEQPTFTASLPVELNPAELEALSGGLKAQWMDGTDPAASSDASLSINPDG